MKQLICIPIVEGYGPPLPSWREECNRCHAPVWRSHVIQGNIEVLCLNCGLKMMQEAPPGEILIDPPTRQISQILASKSNIQNN